MTPTHTRSFPRLSDPYYVKSGCFNASDPSFCTVNTNEYGINMPTGASVDVPYGVYKVRLVLNMPTGASVDVPYGVYKVQNPNTNGGLKLLS